jgi:hypothetical protein
LISYLPHKKIDKKKWDRCVDSDPEASVFFYSWFLDKVCDNWDGLVSGDYEAVFALPYKSRFGIRYIVQPFFTRTLDICSGNKKLKNTGTFLQHIPSKFRLLEFCLNEDDSTVPEENLKEKKYQSVLLDKPFDQLRKSFSNSTVQNIKKAGKNNLSVIHTISPKEITGDFRKLKGKDIGKFGSADYRKLQKLMEACLEHNAGYARAALNQNGERLASAFFMHAHHHIIYLKGSTSERGKSSGAMHLIMSSLMNEFSGSGTLLDFGGSSVSSLATFFKSFGATDHTYYSFSRNNLPAALRWLK